MSNLNYLLPMKYVEIRVYKYKTVEDYSVYTGIAPPATIDTELIKLDANGWMYIKPGYAWDGPSGPTIDTDNFMTGSLVHDAFYQLIREGHLSREYGHKANVLLRDMCLKAGMSSLRAWYVYKSVEAFGFLSLKREPPIKILEV
jgi:hypothetical protein